MGNNLLVAKNVTKAYGNKVALKDFSIQIPKASVYGLLGPNGAGKTTFIRIINQITMPDFGEMILDGERLSAKHISQIGYMPEERGLYKNMKVGDQCIYLAQLKGLSKKEAKKRLNFWFEKLNISDWWGRKLRELSKGMSQKIQFIVTVLHEPKLLIFDEPFSGFDPVNANIIRDEILELQKKGATIIFSTHRMESVEDLCDHVALIHRSEKILDGPIHSIKEKFKQEAYWVELKNVKSDFFEAFKNSHHLENIDERNGLKKFKIFQENLTSRELITELNGLGEIITFREEIPSMNQVFLTAVNQ